MYASMFYNDGTKVAIKGLLGYLFPMNAGFLGVNEVFLTVNFICPPLRSNSIY